MAVRMTHKQMIMLFILVAIFIGLLLFILGPGGSVYVTVSLIIIFLVVKLRQYLQGEDEQD